MGNKGSVKIGDFGMLYLLFPIIYVYMVCRPKKPNYVICGASFYSLWKPPASFLPLCASMTVPRYWRVLDSLNLYFSL